VNPAAITAALLLGAAGTLAALYGIARALNHALIRAYEDLDARMEDVLDDPWDRDLRQLTREQSQP
jgi:hypothetical protein